MPTQAEQIAEILRRKVPKQYMPHMVELIRDAMSGQSLTALDKYTRIPVGMREFVQSPYYLNKADAVYPEVLREMEIINSGRYVEAVLTGGIGSGKTTVALYTTGYQLYLLSCLKSPHEQFGLDPSSEILLIFQSITAKLAKMVSYDRFRDMIEQSPYFQEKFPPDPNMLSKMIMPGRIEVIPVSGADTAAIGQNVIGGVIDELNYMAVIEKSKASVDGGTYDQAVSVYNSISRRRKTRFMENGALPGILCLVSSRKYPGQFTDRKEAEAKNDPTIYVYDKRVWEIKPKGTYSGETFKVFVGDATRKPRILLGDEKPRESEAGLVMDIPLEYRSDFGVDIINALREIAGVSTQARHPFMLDTEAVVKCFNKKTLPILSSASVDFDQEPLKVLLSRMMNKSALRFAHVDLGLTSDSAGVACGYIEKFIPVKRGLLEEYLPVVRFDFVLEVRPPKGGEIKFFKIRDLFFKLRQLGLPLKWVTYDSYQSVDSIQLLRHQGFVTGNQSMDTTPLPYEMLKQAFYDGRVVASEHVLARTECTALERDPVTGKIDHPPAGSKDCSDAMAGVLYGLTTRRELWFQHEVPFTMIPNFAKEEK